jgi:hypothetical protein
MSRERAEREARTAVRMEEVPSTLEVQSDPLDQSRRKWFRDRRGLFSTSNVATVAQRILLGWRYEGSAEGWQAESADVTIERARRLAVSRSTWRGLGQGMVI